MWVGLNIHGLALAFRLWHYAFSIGGAFMIDHEKFQKGRLWAYAVGIVLFVAVVAWKFVAR